MTRRLTIGLPDTPAARYRKPPEPVLGGINANEHLMYLADTKTDWETPMTVDARQRQSVDARLEHLSYRQKIMRYTAVDYFCDSLVTANVLAKNKSPVYFYHFRKVRDQAESLGAYHGAEIPYVFDTHDVWLPVKCG